MLNKDYINFKVYIALLLCTSLFQTILIYPGKNPCSLTKYFELQPIYTR